MSERKDNCPNCHMRNLGRSNAQVLEEFADELNAVERKVQQEAWDRSSEGWDGEGEQLEVEAFTYRVVALRARAKAKGEN